MSAESRAQSLADIQSVLDNKVRPVDASLLAAAPSPFVPHRGIVELAEEEDSTVQLSDEELLGELSNFFNPTGIFMFGGEFYLIFKEKKLKVGSELGITFNDVEYNVIITEITGSTYKVRHGDSELQQKLK